MVQTKYSSTKLLTPIGPIGITLNGISIYNYSIMQNTITESYTSSTLTSGNLNYESSTSLKQTLNTDNSTTIQRS